MKKKSSKKRQKNKDTQIVLSIFGTVMAPVGVFAFEDKIIQIVCLVTFLFSFGLFIWWTKSDDFYDY